MKRQRSQSIEPGRDYGRLILLAILALVVGALAGLLGALFRLSLIHADIWRNALIARAHGWGLAGFLTVVVTLSVLVAFAAWLVRRVAPYASGSGIPDVEAVLSERILALAVLAPVPGQIRRRRIGHRLRPCART